MAFTPCTARHLPHVRGHGEQNLTRHSLTLGELAHFSVDWNHKSTLRTNRPVSLIDTARAAKCFVTPEVGVSWRQGNALIEFQSPDFERISTDKRASIREHPGNLTGGAGHRIPAAMPTFED
jgi:hypothetical protein